MTLQQQLESGLSHHQAGRLADAEKIYRQILAQEPEHAVAMHYLGLIAHQAGQIDSAVDLIRRALALRPNYAEAHSNLGNALKDKGQLEEAIASYRQAIRLKSDFADAHNNLGIVLKSVGRLDEAIARYREAIRLKPDFIQGYNNLGIALKNLGRLDEAIALYRQAIQLTPDYAAAHNNLGNALKDAGRLDEAFSSYREALHLKPDYPRAHSNLILAMHYDPASDATTIAAEAVRWNQRHAEPLKKLVQPHANNRDPNRRLRIGYVSADFCDHASAFFLLPLFRNHDREQVEVFCYSQGNHSDEANRQMRKAVPHWCQIEPMSDEAVAEKIRADNIDLLVDLKLHTSDNRLLMFAHKPAPVQVSWLGYPGITGVEAIDYRLSDPYLDPPTANESLYSEKTIRLPHSFWCYDPLENSGIPVNSLPALQTNVVTFGCLNRLFKINDSLLSLWAGVLREVESSRLLLLAPPGSHRQRILDRLSHDGIPSHRVDFVSPQVPAHYLQLYHRIDLGLDTFPYNGHTTSLDSLWMGVPIVTLIGQTPVARAGFSQLSNLGLTDLAAKTPDEFVQIAASLVKDLPRLAHLRQTLRQRMEQSPLMHAQSFTRDIESAYRQMWQTYCATA
jgi:protein O-GlcNAc transferase